MAGIYIHIPFCKKACHYCDFHFSTNRKNLPEMVEMIKKEIVLRKNYLNSDQSIETIYFGGGTPSILPIPALEGILETVHKYYSLDLKELTVEANPDDLDGGTVKKYVDIGIDRLSIGVQSFHNDILKFYNRSHNAEQSLNVIDLVKDGGIKKLSIDLIFGFPYKDHSLWERDLELAIEKDPGHISSYGLTIESKTALGNWTEKGSFSPASEDFMAEEFEMLQKSMKNSGYIQYEISNFGKEGMFGLHNRNYWRGIPYLGIGPGAHSFDGKNRGHNVAHNPKYIHALSKNELAFHKDFLSPTDRINEYLLTALRTIWGIDIDHLRALYQLDIMTLKQKEIAQLAEGGMISCSSKAIVLTEKGKLLADYIASRIFV
ncbi:radical SAM family heme chaperone HemW [Negadavirga shengliensis]|uniref:Heme chaperone HemW n=1 Tax=Negadavirga shengliensis TaxID=1389218 RepID=A0ABV9T1F8_9BACT